MKKSQLELIKSFGYSKEETKVIQMLAGLIGYEIGGHENAMLDGHISKEEFTELTNYQARFEIAENALKEAYRVGYLETPVSCRVVEAKHLKFMGNDKLKELIGFAVVTA